MERNVRRDGEREREREREEKMGLWPCGAGESSVLSGTLRDLHVIKHVVRIRPGLDWEYRIRTDPKNFRGTLINFIIFGPFYVE